MIFFRRVLIEILKLRVLIASFDTKDSKGILAQT